MPDGLILSRDELLRSHDYASLQTETGYRLHGGFLSDGRYASPRTLVRTPAVERWAQAVLDKGGTLIDVSQSILPTETWPNFAQSKFLLKRGLDRTFWTSLTTTGIVEGRGVALCTFSPPDFQPLVQEDLSGTLTGHLAKGLLWAHGADEGGDPGDRSIGAHDVMWFAVRDKVFARDLHPMPEVERVTRTEPERQMPQIPAAHENLVKFLMSLLVVEVRAESFFSHCCALLRDRELFTDRRAEAEHAAAIVERIRQDESIHVRYLQVFISEMRQFTFGDVKGGDVKGGDVKGATFVDPIWDRVRGFVQPERRRAMYAAIQAEAEQKLGPDKARRFLAEFDALEKEHALVPA
jgi:hypothetical protein